MSSYQVEHVFNYVPAGTVAAWAMLTGWFARPEGEQCTTGQQVGLGFITAFLALVCWTRSSVCLYAARKERRCSCKGLLWRALAVFEGGVTTLLFIAVTLVTAPGSTCWFTADNRLSTFTTYNILAGATLLAFAAPRLLGWLMTVCEAVGARVRTPVPQPTRDAPYLPEPSAPAYVHFYARVRKAFHAKALELQLWQLLPAATVIVYRSCTAYWTQVAKDTCTDGERSWLIAFISVVGAVGFFLNLESYEKSRADPDCCRPDDLKFRTSPWWYNLLSVAQSLFTTAAFAGVALLTPPGSTCLFPGSSASGLIQRLAAYILVPMCAAAVAGAFVKLHLASPAALSPYGGGLGDGGDGGDIEVQRSLSSRVPRSDDPGAANDAHLDDVETAAAAKLGKAPKGGYSIAVSATDGAGRPTHTLGDEDEEAAALTGSPTAQAPVV